MTRRSIVAALAAVLVVSTASAGSAAIRSGSPAAGLPAAVVAGSNAAGHDYATDVFGDPWDYSNLSDLLVDTGPAMKASGLRFGSGRVTTHFTGSGYISPIWGGYGGPLFLGRDGGKPGSALDPARYRTVVFQAYSNRDVPAGLNWFKCPRAVVAASCGGGTSFMLRAGWHTYVLNPGASVFPGWPIPWAGGTINGLRLAVSPGAAGSDFALDWFRVVQPGSGAQLTWSNGGLGASEYVWDTDTNDANNLFSQTGFGVVDIPDVTGSSGTVDLSALPPGIVRVGVNSARGFSGWQSVSLASPLPRFITPNAVGDRDYASMALRNSWDFTTASDFAKLGNARNVSFAGGQLAATNTSNDPYVSLRLGSGGIDSRFFRNLTVTSAYDGPFDLRDMAGGGTMARFQWTRSDRAAWSQTDDILTYSGSRTISIDMGLPNNQLIEPGTSQTSFVSPARVTALRWDPNEDRGSRRWYLKDVQLRSDFATSGTFPVAWQDAAYQAGGTATIVADTDRTGCNGVTVASGVPVQAGTNTTVWNTAGVARGRYWLCLRITRGAAVTSAYAGGVLSVGANPPVMDASPTAAVDGGYLSGQTYTVSGWAFDPNSPQQAIHVDLYDRRPDGSQVGVRLTTGRPRPDVARLYPGTGQNTGFSGSLQLVGGGRHSVCAYAINVGAGGHRLLKCYAVDMPVPKGSLDTAVRTAPGALRVSGWASDPTAPTAVENVHVYVTGPAGRTLTAVHTGGARPDVRAAFPWAGPNSGFTGTVPAAGAGVNKVCAYAIAVHPPGSNPLIGCRTVTV
jgi:hypothetical protein